MQCQMKKIFIKNTHNQNNVKTIFLYFSTTEELISRPRRRGFTRVNYVFLNYDYLVADNISINLFKSQQTKIKIHKNRKYWCRYNIKKYEKEKKLYQIKVS